MFKPLEHLLVANSGYLFSMVEVIASEFVFQDDIDVNIWFVEL